MLSREYLFQLTQAMAMHSPLHARASETDRYPTGRDTARTAGLKMKATLSNATVKVQSLPVDFWF